MPCIDVVEYQRFRGPCCLRLRSTSWCYNPEDLSWIITPSSNTDFPQVYQ